MTKSFKFLYILLIICNLSQGQHYYFEKFSVAQGLSQASIYCITEDKIGNLWFATESGGLNMYDGNELTHRYLSDGLPDESIRCVFEDSKGRLWIGTENGGACFLFQGKYTILNIDNGLSDNSINAIAEDKEGRIWIGTKNNGLNIYDAGKITQYSRENGLLSDEISCFYQNENGEMYIGTRRGLNLSDKNKLGDFSEIIEFKGLFIHSIINDHQNTKWIATNSGLFTMNKQQQVTPLSFPQINHKNITCIYQDYHKNYWIGSNEGLLKTNYNDNTKTYSTTFYNEENGLSNNNIKCILQDHSGAIWIGTKFGGVNKFIGEKFISLDMNDGLSEQVITSLCVLPDSSIAYGSFSNGITIKKGKKNIYLNDEQLINTTINTLESDDKGKLWIGTDGQGLFYYANKKLNAYNENITANEVNVLLNDSRGILWVGTKHRGLKAIYYDGNTLKYNELSSLIKYENLSVSGICEDHLGNIWATTESGIIRITNPQQVKNDALISILYNQFPGSYNTPTISCFADKSTEKIWFGTQGKGIFFFYKNKFYPFPNNLILKDIVINSIYATNNELWLGTDKNLKVVTLDNFNIQTYSFTEGFEGIQCNRGATCVDYNGYLWMGTLNGAYKINTKEPSPTPPFFTPSLQITGIKFNFNDYDWSPYCDSLTGFYKTPNRLELPYNINHLTFDFMAKGLIHPEAIEYKFQLLGHDEGFSPPNKKNEITYTNLEPGEYEFILYSRLRGNAWNKQATTLKIVILPPFWATLWFRSLIVFIAFALVILFYKWRVQRLNNEKKRLENLVKERTQDLEAEKHKSEELLHNILPEEIAQELKLSGTAKTKLYENASVMFTDFKGFTALSGQLTPEVLVNELNNIFIQFDAITDKYRLEKIKTIGDSYMCAGGIPVENKTHAVDCVLAAFEFIQFINTFETSIGHAWEVRVGIHSGPLIAGVVGKKKFAYDIWGDSVNVASRMESNSEPGKLNVSQSTYELIKEYFICTPRGELHVKNKGDMTMYFVERLKPEFAADENGLIANNKLIEDELHSSTKQPY